MPSSEAQRPVLASAEDAGLSRLAAFGLPSLEKVTSVSMMALSRLTLLLEWGQRSVRTMSQGLNATVAPSFAS